MKDKLDAIWNDSRIACPNNLVAWNTTGVGYSRYEKLGVWFKKGTLRRPKLNKVKGKGWTWLCKNYGFIYRAKII